MLNRHSVDADPMADAILVTERKTTAEDSEAISAEEAQIFQTLSRKRDVAPVAHMPKALASNPKSRSLRRILTREQGRALELIGHAVDYLNDCYLYEGDDSEIINIGGSSSEAIQILVSMRWQVLQSVPARESKSQRLWNVFFHRRTNNRPGVIFQRTADHGSQAKPGPVLPLTSSR